MVIEEERQVHPKDKANFISRLTLWWVFGLIWKGQSRPLVSEDLYAVRDEDRAERLTRRLQEKWENEKSQARKLQKVPRMWKALLFFFARKDYWFITMTICIHLIARNVAWFSAIKLLALIGKDLKSGVPYDKCLVYLWGIALGYLILSISVNHFHLYGSVLGIRARAAVVALLYKKVLCLGKCRVTPGHVMELICDDSQRLVTSAEWHIQDGIRTVSYCLCAVGWLYYFVGWEVLPVCLLSIFVGLYRLFISNIDSKLRSSASRLADKRLGYLREMFTGIRSIKLNCLENIIEERIHQTRRREVKYKTIRWIIMTLCYSFSSYGKQLTIFLVITLLMFMESSPISYEAVSSLLVLTNEVTKGLMLGIPTCIRLVIDVQTSLQRIQDFLEIGEERGNFAEKDPSEDDFDIFHNIHEADDEEFFIRGEGKPTTVTTSQQNVSNSKKGYKTKPFLSLRDITCKHPSPVASFIQLDSNDAPSLNFINLDISEPGLVVITGPVGSGKSSLLTSVLSGELLVTNGAVARSGKLAYVSETPWVFPGTIRENILFGLDYSELRYLQAIKACQLERDLQSFPEGDLSRIGEHGATLSGGQRTRISLARAVYSQGDLYLLDDPLSSLDAKVGAEVFRKCIRGLLNNRIVLLVTNMVQYIKEADYVVKLQTGFIVAQGCLESVKEKVLDKIPDDHLYGAENDELHPVKHLEEEKDESKKHKSTGMLVHEDKEDREIGGVSFKIYREYFLCGVPVLVLLMVVLTYVAGQVLVVLLDIKVARLSKQSNEGESGLHVLINYSILLMATIILISISITGLLLVPTNAAYAVHQKMVNCLIKAPLSFYAANPVGRLINRFSQDINNLDEFLPMFLTIFCLYLAPSVAAIVLASISTPKLIPFSLVACLVVFFSLKIYLRSGMDLKRLMTIAGGPLYSHFSNTMEGIRTIRVYNKQRDFETKVLRLIDHHGRALLAYYTVVRWFSITLDILAVVFVAIVVVFLVFLMNGSSDSGVVAIAIIYATNTVQVVQYIVRMIAEVSAQMTSAERALAYTKIKPEKGRDTKKFPSEIWPSRGGIQFENVSLRHCEDSPNVLHNLTFKIDPFEKIGVAGRTGAGKSSLIASLMRLADEIDGEIIIDNVNIKEMNVQSTRKAISVISQDPVLISGSIRSVLDPFKLFNDCEIWDALERMQIKSLIFSLPQQLNNDVAPSRSGFSIGERQLLHMARILLEKNKIIVFDEATGKVDRKTNERIQEIVSKVFHDCTVLTVAHRLDTILNCDRIMVLDQGKIVEFDRPDILLAKENGLLRQLYNISSGK